MKKKHRIDHRFKTEYEKWCLLPDLTEEERKPVSYTHLTLPTT